MTLTELGWDTFFQNAWDAADRAGHFPARLIEEHKGACRLASERGDFLATVAGRLRFDGLMGHCWPAVGDWVEAADGVIYGLLPRRSKFSRKAAGKRTDEQVVAANVDTVLIVSAYGGDFNPRRFERYLTVVWDSGAQPVLLLNKADLCAEPDGPLAEAELAAPGVPVHSISALDGAGVEQLARYLRPGRTVALVGSSGVGKSTLMNRLMGAELQVVREVREDDGRGRHTTTARRLVVLPSGALLIDTPGMRELQLWSSEDAHGQAFEDVEILALDCRFRNCAHDAEPGCAVLAAVERGDLSRNRFASYHKLRKELAYLARKQDVRLQIEENRKWKQIHKEQKRMYKKR